MFNFIELGPDVLEVDASWFIPIVLRPKLIQNLDGGWSHVLKMFLRRMLVGPQSLTVSGVMVHVVGIEEECFKLQASMATLLTDGEGWMKALQWNGHASMRPDWYHSNVFKKNSGMVSEELGYVDITCSNPCRLRRCTEALLFATIDRVLDGRQSLLNGEAGWNAARLKN